MVKKYKLDMDDVWCVCVNGFMMMLMMSTPSARQGIHTYIKREEA